MKKRIEIKLPKSTPRISNMFRKLYDEGKLKTAIEKKENSIVFLENYDEQIEGLES